MAVASPVRILIVDDSVLFRGALTARLRQVPRFEVVGSAVNAGDALQKIKQLSPDVVTLDVEMPGMNGIELLHRLLPEKPVPVVLVSSLSISVFDALSAGAVDFVRKPDKSIGGTDAFFKALIQKIEIAANAVVRLRPGAAVPHDVWVPAPAARPDSAVIAIGASTGGTEATLTVLRELPADIPGILVVQHMPPGFTNMYAGRLNGICRMEVKEAENGDEIKRGRVLIAPGDKHMTVQKTGTRYTVRCQAGEKVSGHCPSVDVMFGSVAECVKRDAIGIILTGMGRDGASGLLAMRGAGAYTIGQDRESSIVYGMPMVAEQIGAVTVQSPVERIPDLLMKQLARMTKS